MRLFLAINLSSDVRRELHDTTLSLRDCAPEVGWVAEARLHLTVKFLGEQPSERVDEITAALSATAARHRHLSMTVGGIGAFPNFRRPRVVWVGVAHDARLELLHHDLEVAFERIGFEVEGRPFRPHITLGRIRTPLPDDRRRELSRAARRIDFQMELDVRTIELMASNLTAAGAAYTTLGSAALRSD